MFIFIEIITCILISSIPIILYLKDSNKDRKKLIQAILSCLILLVGCLIRTIAIESYPIGLNQDEASIGYEAYSVSNYGIDRNNTSIPVHFISWGSGQNALYGYLIMPFINIFGTNNFSIRFPMSLIGCITLLVAYLLFKEAFKDKKSLIALFIFSIIPWHILKSRWGLESNLFPDLIFYSISLIYFALKNKKKIYFIFSSIILGISTYSYGTSYLFVPIFSIIIYIYLIVKKEINIKNTTYNGLENAIKYVYEKKYDNLYITNLVNQPYIYYLFYNKIDPNYYIENRVIENKKVMFQNITCIKNIYFFSPKNIEKNNIYILDNIELENYNLDDFKIEKFNNYSVIY